MTVIVQAGPFDFAALTRDFGKGHGTGAVVTFTGVVRDDGGLEWLELEHYPAMTRSALEAIRQEAMTRWSLTDALVVHRFGRMAPGEQIMMVATAAAHRAAAFEAAEFLMDYLKSRAPFWKKEKTAEETRWVEAKETDEAALRRWRKDEG